MQFDCSRRRVKQELRYLRAIAKFIQFRNSETNVISWWGKAVVAEAGSCGHWSLIVEVIRNNRVISEREGPSRAESNEKTEKCADIEYTHSARNRLSVRVKTADH